MGWQVSLLTPAVHSTAAGGVPLRFDGAGRVFGLFSCWEQRLAQILAGKQGTLHGYSGGAEAQAQLCRSQASGELGGGSGCSSGLAALAPWTRQSRTWCLLTPLLLVCPLFQLLTSIRAHIHPAHAGAELHLVITGCWKFVEDSLCPRH